MHVLMQAAWFARKVMLAVLICPVHKGCVRSADVELQKPSTGAM